MSNFTRKQFIEKLAPFAISDMRKTQVPASLTIAQAILESNNGNSTLTTTANNLFGIKGTGTIGSVEMYTTEYINGKPERVLAKFRKYRNWGESVKDHSDLFLNGVSWDRNKYRTIIGSDGITAAREVAKAGYATDPKYADKLIALINENNLLQYDSIAENVGQTESSLLVQIVKLAELVNLMHTRLSRLEEYLEEIPAPQWFKDEFPKATDLLHQKTGTRTFWRAYAATLRTMKQHQNYFS